jgi:hypothetical protein
MGSGDAKNGKLEVAVMRSPAAFLLGCSLTFCAPSLVYGEPITFHFEGVVTQPIGRLDFFGAGPIRVGTPFSGEFSYDPATGKTLPVDIVGATFLLFDDRSSMTVRVGTLQRTMPRLSFRTEDSGSIHASMRGGFPFDLQLSALLAPGDVFPKGATSARTVLDAFDPSRSFFQLGLFPDDDDPPAEFFGRLSSLTQIAYPDPVPEPSTVLLVATGAVLLVRRRQACPTRVP